MSSSASVDAKVSGESGLLLDETGPRNIPKVGFIVGLNTKCIIDILSE